MARVTREGGGEKDKPRGKKKNSWIGYRQARGGSVSCSSSSLLSGMGSSASRGSNLLRPDYLEASVLRRVCQRFLAGRSAFVFFCRRLSNVAFVSDVYVFNLI